MHPYLIYLVYSVFHCYSIKITWNIFREQQQISYDFIRSLDFGEGVSAGVVLWKVAVWCVRVKRVESLLGWKSCW